VGRRGPRSRLSDDERELVDGVRREVPAREEVRRLRAQLREGSREGRIAADGPIEVDPARPGERVTADAARRALDVSHSKGSLKDGRQA